ncbi:hypothetical protein BH10CHL1_BH10CHL1_07990 [soil metagenome]
MSKLILQKVITALTVAILLTTSFAGLATAADSLAPVAQQVRGKQVKGTISGGKFAKIWLGLETETPNAQIIVTSDWDRDNPLQNGVGFFILDDTGLVRAQAGDALNTIALGAGNVVDGISTQLRASLNAVGLAKYTVVVYNDSSTDANFTLTTTDAILVDDSNQVQNPNATAISNTVANTTTLTTTTTTTNTAAVTTVATAAATPAATVATTTTTAPVAAATVAPVVAGPVGVIKAKELSGELPEQNAQHFLGLEPSERDATITLRLSFDPQDSTELARRLNFWVLDQAGFAQFQGGTNASDVAIAAGSRDVDSQINERVAHFKAAGFGPYTVIVYNNSRVPGTYSLTVDGALLVDDSGQTKNAQQVAATVSLTGTTTATTTTTTSAATPAATAVGSTSTTTTTTAARTGTPGGSYTVKSGDTLALIARDIYSDYKLYEQLCAFNGITNCNTIEVGQVVKLPTLDQIKTAATAAPAATATKAATPAAAATVAPSTATTTTTSATPVATTVAVATTAAVTSTGSVSSTTPVTTTGATTATTGTSTGTGTIIDVAVANGAFKTLIAALQATGLENTLKGPGPFTVFAPTDAAFARLPAGALQQLMANPSGQLTDIVRYHVIPSKLMAADLSNGLQATTVQGKPVKFEVSGNTIKINGAQIITKDIQASNGVIHVIENVIIPPAE